MIFLIKFYLYSGIAKIFLKNLGKIWNQHIKTSSKNERFFINEYVHVKYIKIKEGLNCFLSLRKLTYAL